MMQNRGIPLPTSTHETEWQIDDNYGLWYYKGFQYFKVKLNDLFIINDVRYQLMCIKPLPKQLLKADSDLVVLLKNTTTKKNKKMPLKTFINTLKRNDVTYEHSAFFNTVQNFIKAQP